MDSKLLAPGVWNVVPNGMSAAFLIAGEKSALLIDSGAGETDVKAVCESLCSLPIELVNTHYHGDHLGGNKSFEKKYMHPADIERLAERDGMEPVREGHCFDLGGKLLEVIETPGHTPGSISIYDKTDNIIFTGDMVSKNPIFLIEGDYNLDAFSDSLRKLMNYHCDMYAAHDPTVNNDETLEKLLETIELYKAGRLEPRQSENSFIKAKTYIAPNGTGFFCPEK